MDIARAPHNAQTKLKTVLTPIWDREMGRRLAIARMKQGRKQAELATLLSTPGHPISQQQIAKVEGGRLERLDVTWARIEAVLGKHAGYVLIARDAALYDEQAIAMNYHDMRQRALRKRNGLDPKLGECPPHEPRLSRREMVRRGRAVPRKRGSAQ